MQKWKKNKEAANSAKRLLAAFSLISLFSLNTPAFAETVFLKGTAYQSGITQKEIKVGASEVIVSNQPIKRVAVTDPSVADMRILSETSALVRGKRLGKTSLLIWEGKDSSVRPTRFDVTVKRDISDLVASLKAVDPNIDVDYIIIPSLRIDPTPPTTSNGAYTTSFRQAPETVGDPAPSVIVNNASSQAQQAQAGQAAAAQQGNNVQERIILSGNVKSAEVIAKAITVAATYMGVSPEMRITTRHGGLSVNEVSQLLSAGGAGGGGGFASGGATQSLNTPLNFTSNVRGNFNTSSIATNADSTIISFLQLVDRPQISVLIRFYEVSRGIGKDFSTNIGWAPGNSGRSGIYGLGVKGNLNPITGTQTINPSGWIGSPLGALGAALGDAAFSAISVAAGGTADGSFFALLPKQQLSIAIQALESRGETKVLAEPNLVVSSGEPGRFLAGGEIPIRNAVSTLGAIGQQVTFETFGISLNVLPTITESDTVLMNISAQTRDIDAANRYSAIDIPAFKTRRADTQVEMDPNQVLIIGGLINSNSLNSLNKIPLIGDIPVLGALARSKSFARNDSELIIVLAPEIVRGGHASQVIKPLALDSSPRPGEFDYIPRRMDLSKTSIPVSAPTSVPLRDPVDLSRPATINDLDHIYK